MLELTAMAMPIPTEVTPARAPSPKRRPDPDEEALLLLAKVLDRAEVARSFAKLAAALLAESAARASVQWRAVADQKVAAAVAQEGALGTRYAHLLKVARAAKEAAVHVAAQRSTRPAGESDAKAAAEPGD